MRKRNRQAAKSAKLGVVLVVSACGGATLPGGGAGAGGSSDSGGGTAEAGPIGCTVGSVTFELMTAGAPSVEYCVGRNCGTEWLAIKSASGQEMQITHHCISDCTSCNQIGCDLLCALPQPVKPEGVRQQWDGMFFTASTCGQGQMCANPNCAPPGKYVATMCAGVKNNADAMFCETDPNQQCVDVEFDYPTTSVVQGTVGPIK
jgi:hypothetical protein